MRIKNGIILFGLLISFMPLKAQVVIAPNPSYTNPAHRPFFDVLLDTNEFLDEPSPEPPSVNEICFDKRIKIKVTSNKGPVETCMFINTKIGLVGYSELKLNNAGICDILTGLPDFKFNILGLKGDLFNYSNRMQKGRLVHTKLRYKNARRVDEHSAAENGILYKKDDSREFLGGKIKAWLYQYENGQTQYYVFGKTLPNKLVMQPLKYLGLFGVGYQYAEEGLFIIMAIEKDGYESSIMEMENVPTCFNHTIFKFMEEQSYTIQNEKIERQQTALDELKTRSQSPCLGLKQQKIDFKKQALQKNKAKYDQVKQNPRATQYQRDQAEGNLQVNFEDAIDEEMLKTKIKICDLETRIANQNRAQGDGSLESLLQCQRDFLRKQQNLKERIKGIDNQYPNQYHKQRNEKMKLFIRESSIQRPCK
ncbi:hypothetical protein [Pedobacter insulae]|uniref:Uncharacterized protein n=1 Tax=Pedobacter insulae TaxID=414048 RepID=A0A1I2Z8T6_9SPHI|nr:hypothetical protein [Pedobacter insulae]SFH33926.1 hypothetical protein SAMN04489864_10955 [Pedobacter insulae]